MIGSIANAMPSARDRAERFRFGARHDSRRSSRRQGQRCSCSVRQRTFRATEQYYFYCLTLSLALRCA
jgi:hypothetical protein